MTRQQHKLLRFIERYQAENDGVSPSFAEMQAALGLGSKSSVSRLVEALIAQGRVRRNYCRARSIEIVGLPGHVSALSDEALLAEAIRRGLPTCGPTIGMAGAELRARDAYVDAAKVGAPRTMLETRDVAWMLAEVARRGLSKCRPAIDITPTGLSGGEADETVAGRVVCHCSDDDGIPDVGVSIGLGGGKALWLGELLARDGGDIGFVLHGPDGKREAASIWPNCEWQDVADILRGHVAPAIAALGQPGRDAGMSDLSEVRARVEYALSKAEPFEAPAPGVAWGDGILNFADIRALLNAAERMERQETERTVNALLAAAADGEQA